MRSCDRGTDSAALEFTDSPCLFLAKSQRPQSKERHPGTVPCPPCCCLPERRPSAGGQVAGIGKPKQHQASRESCLRLPIPATHQRAKRAPAGSLKGFIFSAVFCAFARKIHNSIPQLIHERWQTGLRETRAVPGGSALGPDPGGPAPASAGGRPSLIQHAPEQVLHRPAVKPTVPVAVP